MDTPLERGPVGSVFVELRGVEMTRRRAQAMRGGGQRTFLLGEGTAPATILDHVDLTVNSGELLAVVGANGAGKSSLLRCLAGIWKPTSGTITIGGFDRAMEDEAIRRFTAYLPPDPGLLWLSIRENLRLFADAYEIDVDVFHERMDSLLRMFDLKEKQDHSGWRLSKGECKKACLAAVLLTGARFYLFDEPFTGGIDPRGTRALRRIMERLAANRNVTVVFATQILELAESLADRIAVMNHGRVLAVGTVDDLRSEAGLDSDAPFAEVFNQLSSRDAEQPVQSFLASLLGL